MRLSTFLNRTITTTLLLFSSIGLATAAGSLAGPEDPTSPTVLTGGGGGGGDQPTPTPPPPDHAWRFEGSARPYYGSEDWGAGVGGNAYVGGIPGDFNVFYPGHDLLMVGGGFGGFARVNGDNYSIFGVRLYGQSLSQYGTKVRGELSLGGQIVGVREGSTTLAVQQELELTMSHTVTFFDQRVNLWVGPVPVEFSASAHGDAGIHGLARIDTSGVTVEAGPFAGARLNATGAVGGEWCVPYVGCVGASAGIEVEVRLFEISAPLRLHATSTSLDTNNVQIRYDLSFALELEALAGRLLVFAEAHLGPAGGRWESELINWDGIFARYDVVSGTGSYCLVGSCIGIDPSSGDDGGELAPVAPAITPVPAPAPVEEPEIEETTEEPEVEEPKVEDPKAEDPKAEDPRTDSESTGK